MPALSIVIAGNRAGDVLLRCLKRLIEQPGIEQAEIIVALGADASTGSQIRYQFPTVNLMQYDARLSLAYLRGKAIAEAKGEIIAILDVYSMVTGNWLEEVLKVHRQRPNWVIGGPVGVAQMDSKGWRDWTTYINEYAMFLPPMPGGEMEILPGSNLSYKREALFKDDKPRFPIFWKTFVNWDVEGGSRLWLHPDMIVELDKPIPFGDYFRTRFDHGRCFAGLRGEKATRNERLMRAATTPLLPGLLLWRWGKRYLARGHHASKFILTLPLQFVLFGNWAFGEFVGYLFGAAESCERLYY